MLSQHLVSTASPEYLATVQEWLNQQRELVVLIRFVYGGGNTEVICVSSFEQFATRLAGLRARDSVIVFRDHKLPLRGIVDDAFIEQCLAAVQDGTEYVVAETEPKIAGSHTWLHNDAGTTHRDLRESLENSRGELVLVGDYPPSLSESEGVLAAYVPDADGVVRPGAY